ncbi:serine O-acetyltransferase [Frankia sp. QA3]|uniref:serine O-acetyltransferase n=1 Tax=Frankia sp. QA3 TaxID=710111 RepID=UPI000269CDBB|nr:serine acetyltransferase [Frankia sp. QA3]EIV95676.1 serine acetyltransferase [Frankia sp. QA3]
MKEAVLRDIDRYVYYDQGGRKPRRVGLGKFMAVLNNPGLQAILVYRFGAFVSRRRAGGAGVPERILGVIAYRLLSRVSQIVTGIWISPEAQVGPGLFIAHFGGVIIGACEIGENCNIGHDVTIGKSGTGERFGRPKIGDRVSVGTGARILGRVDIGNDALIGANAVVTKSIAARAVVVGVPGRVVSGRGAFGYVEYFGMAEDRARAASHALADEYAEETG